MKPENPLLNFETNAGEAQASPVQSDSGLFKSTRLSSLPKLSDRPKFRPPVIAPMESTINRCIGCDQPFDQSDQIQESLGTCRKCLSVYAKVDAAFDDRAKRRKQETLEKVAGGLK